MSRFTGQNFALCGKTIESLRRNVTSNLSTWLAAELEKLAGDLPIAGVIVDPSAASFLETIRRHGRFYDIKASNAVLDGIRNVSTHLKAGDLLICDGCADCIREFGLYRWDEKAIGGDRPVKENDHSMDDVRYFVNKAWAPALISF